MTSLDGAENVNVAEIAPVGMVAPLPYRLIFLINDEAPPAFHSFYQSFSETCPGAELLPLSEDSIETLTRAEVDAICGFEHLGCWRAFERVYHCGRPGRPLCVLLGEPDEEAADDAEAPVDLFAPMSARALRTQLRSAVQMRRQLAQLEARKQELEARVAAQERQIADYERSHREMSLLKGAMVRNVSHELRTPLLQLKTAVSMLHEDAPESTLTQLALQATGRLEATVQNITQLASSIEINLAPVVVREVIQAAVRALGRTLMHKQHIERVEMRLPDRLPAVLGDKQGLVTVIVQLLDNALKFSSERVVISAVRDGDRVAVSVLDTGIGIAEGELEHIFDSFYQVDSSGTRRYGGSGVGLAIVKLILDKHNAPISVHTRQSEGSTFTFHLKLADLVSDKRSLAD